MRETEPETHEGGSAPRRVLELFSGKWASMVLHELHAFHGGTCRTGESQRSLPDISKKMLTQTLREITPRRRRRCVGGCSGAEWVVASLKGHRRP